MIDCGWRDEVKAHCKGNRLKRKEFKINVFLKFKEVVKQKGLDNITVEDLVLEMVPKGRALVPDSVKKELLMKIRHFLASQSDL